MTPLIRVALCTAVICLCATLPVAQEPTQRQPSNQDAKQAERERQEREKQEAKAAKGAERKASQGQPMAEKAAASGNVEQELTRLIAKYTEALQRKDMTTLENIWADDFTFINPSGDLLSKAQRMENVRSGATKFDSIDTSAQKIRAYGDVAVATGLVTIKGQYSGQEGSGQYRITHAWVKRDGRWQMVALQMTRVASQ